MRERSSVWTGCGSMIRVRHFLQLLWKRIVKDDVFGLAAQLAYFFLLSLFPLLITLVTLLAYLPLSEEDLLYFLGEFVPEDSMTLIKTSLNDIMNRHRGKLLSIGIIGTVWSASAVLNAVLRSLNKAYGVKETRPLFISRGMSILFTVAFIVLIVLALMMLVFGKQLGSYLFAKLGFSSFIDFWNVFRWILSFFIIFFIFLLLYWIAPNKKIQCVQSLPGAFFATAGWLLVSSGFSYYVGNFGNYTATYGSIGAVIVLMIWFYLTGAVIILGGEINAVVSKMKEGNC